MTTLYQTTVTVRGGRTGRAQSPDGRFDLALSMPRELGGAGGPGTNPEQLFAAGYAACFESALRLVARQQKLALPDDTAITAEVRLVRRPDAPFALAATLTGHLPRPARGDRPGPACRPPTRSAPTPTSPAASSPWSCSSAPPPHRSANAQAA